MQCEGKINKSTVGNCPRAFRTKIYFLELSKKLLCYFVILQTRQLNKLSVKNRGGQGIFSCIIHETSSVRIVSTWFTIVGIHRDFPGYKEWSFIFSICTQINASEHKMSISTTNLKH